MDRLTDCLLFFCWCNPQRYSASRYADMPPAASQSHDDLTERIEQALRISSSALSAYCNNDQSMVLLQFVFIFTIYLQGHRNRGVRMSVHTRKIMKGYDGVSLTP